MFNFTMSVLATAKTIGFTVKYGLNIKLWFERLEVTKIFSKEEWKTIPEAATFDENIAFNKRNF